MRVSNGVKKYILNFSIFIFSVIFSVITINNTIAQGNDTSSDAFSKLIYPIMELGGCKDRADCKIYCDDSANMSACVSYAEKNNLFSQEDLQVAKKFVATGGKGPGNCNGKEECQTFCDDKVNIDECVSYAENNGLMSEQDLQKAKKVQSAIKKGVKFPACKNKKECDTYCEESSHMEECITFAKEAGFLSDKELENTGKVLTAMKQGVNPPACKGKEACDIYCAEEDHADECINFAIASGLVTSEKAKIIKETGGKGPGGCKNKTECDSYCSISDNKETCFNFALKNNLISQEEFDKIKQNGTGPGNGAGQGQGGPGQGTGPGNGAGQGGGTPGGGLEKPANSTKCIADCESVGKDCVSKASEKSKICLSKGTNCRTVTCETFGAGGTRPTTQEEWNRCASYCRTIEDNCYADISPTEGDCTTTKDVCVMNCQKESKPTKPTQPSQSNKPSQPNQSNQPTQPIKPTKPLQPNQSGQPTQPTKPNKPSQPNSSIKPTQSTAPTQPTGKCGDGICGKMEQADPTLCPQDCSGQ